MTDQQTNPQTTDRDAARAVVLGKTTRRIETVDHDGERYYLRSLSEGELSQWQAQATGRDADPAERAAWRAKMRPSLIAATLCTTAGDLLFEPNEWPLIQEIDGDLAEKLFDKAFALAGLDRDEAKQKEQLKNLPATAGDADS